MELFEKLCELITAFNGRMTAKKATFQLEQSVLKYEISGIVLTNPQGDRMIIDMGRCNLFTLKQWQDLTNK
jgi:hypothetical protein